MRRLKTRVWPSHGGNCIHGLLWTTSTGLSYPPPHLHLKGPEKRDKHIRKRIKMNSLCTWQEHRLLWTSCLNCERILFLSALFTTDLPQQAKRGSYSQQPPFTMQLIHPQSPSCLYCMKLLIFLLFSFMLQLHDVWSVWPRAKQLPEAAEP